MLVKIGDVIINLSYAVTIDLNPVGQANAVELMLPYGGRRIFYDADADVLRWYLNHPTSDVIDIKNFKEG